MESHGKFLLILRFWIVWINLVYVNCASWSLRCTSTVRREAFGVRQLWIVKPLVYVNCASWSLWCTSTACREAFGVRQLRVVKPLVYVNCVSWSLWSWLSVFEPCVRRLAVFVFRAPSSVGCDCFRIPGMICQGIPRALIVPVGIFSPIGRRGNSTPTFKIVIFSRIENYAELTAGKKMHEMSLTNLMKYSKSYLPTVDKSV